MSEQRFATLDVRPILREGGEPFGAIMQSVAALAPGQGLRLLATFEPVPLFKVLGAKGFAHEAHRLGDGDWEVLFTPAADSTVPTPRGAPGPAAAGAWPAAAATLDNRGLLPPEPMVRILEAMDNLAPGEVLEAINDREPLFLYPELEKRGHAIRTERHAGGWRLLIRHGGKAP